MYIGFVYIYFVENRLIPSKISTYNKGVQKVLVSCTDLAYIIEIVNSY